MPYPEACYHYGAVPGLASYRNNAKLCFMDNKLLEILACPLCKGELIYDEKAQELICRFDKLAYLIREDIPIMLPEEARPLTEEER